MQTGLKLLFSVLGIGLLAGGAVAMTTRSEPVVVPLPEPRKSIVSGALFSGKPSLLTPIVAALKIDDGGKYAYAAAIIERVSSDGQSKDLPLATRNAFWTAAQTSVSAMQVEAKNLKPLYPWLSADLTDLSQLLT